MIFIVGCLIGWFLWLLAALFLMTLAGLTEYWMPTWTLIFIPLFAILFTESLKP